MKTKTILVLVTLLLAAAALVMTGQDANFRGVIQEGEMLKLAVPEFRGSGDAQKLMDVFNTTLWDEIDGGGVVKLVAKSVYPLNVPQRPEDFVAPTSRVKSNGPWLTDWSNPPVEANNLAFGYAASQPGQLIVLGNLYNLSQPTPAAATLFMKRYSGSLDEAGAREVAREYAADILAQFGGKSLSGTKIYFVSDRSVPVRIMPDGTRISVKEIWSMDYDGSNQRQLTFYKSVSSQPALSTDGKMFAFSTYPQNERNGHLVDEPPIIMIHSVEPDRKLTFYPPKNTSVVETPEFTPDGKHVLFSTKIGTDKNPRIYMSNLQGGELTLISRVDAIDTEPKVNPKTGTEILFTSSRSGHEQLWKMNIDGSGAEMLTDGTGEASNPSWRPDGQHVVFSWTRGFTYGQFNVFVMDVVNRSWNQLTHDTGDNENPTWAPDGLHLVYASKRDRVSQIFTMLADGTHVRQLTTKGNNTQPVWAKGIN